MKCTEQEAKDLLDSLQDRKKNRKKNRKKMLLRIGLEACPYSTIV